MDPVSNSTRVREIMSAALANKKRRRPAYSLRALARDMGVSPAFLSHVLRGSKQFPLDRVRQLTELLDLTPADQAGLVQDIIARTTAQRGGYRFLRERYLARAEERSRYPIRIVDAKDLDVLSDWNQLRVLTLMTCENAVVNPGWIARQLKISRGEARNALYSLESRGFVTVQGGRTLKSEKHLTFHHVAPTASGLEFQKRGLERAFLALEQKLGLPSDCRHIAQYSVAVNSTRVPDAKRMMRAFHEKLLRFLSDGPCDSIYHYGSFLLPETPVHPTPNLKNPAK